LGYPHSEAPLRTEGPLTNSDENTN
jgi:hypothetical protein